MIPEVVSIGGQRFLLVGAKGKTKTRFPSLKKSKPQSAPKSKEKAKEEKSKKKENHLRQLAALIKKPKLSREDSEELEDLEKMYPSEAKALRAQLPKSHKQKVIPTEDEKGEDFADSLVGDDDEDEDEDEDEDGDEEEDDDSEEKKPKEVKTKTQAPSPPPSQKNLPKKTETKGKNKAVKGKKGEGEEVEEEKKPKRDILKTLMNAQELEDDEEGEKGKRRRGDDDEEEDLTEVPRLNGDSARGKALSLFKDLNSDIEDDDDPDTVKRKREFQDKMVKHVDIGLDKHESQERQHLLKKQKDLGLSHHEERRLQKLTSQSSPSTVHYDDLEPYEQKEMREKWVEEKSKDLLSQNGKDIEDHERSHDFARAAAKGLDFDEEDKKEVTRLARKNPEKMKAIFHAHGVDLSLPEEEDHPASWKPVHNKTHLDGKAADKAVIRYHLLQEKSKEGDYEAQQDFAKLKKILDDPHNLSEDARKAIDKAGIKTKWNPEPSGADDFAEEHEHVLRQTQLHLKEQEEKAKRKEEKEKEEEAKKHDSKLDPESVLGRSHDDIIDQYHRLHYQAKKSPLAQTKLKRLQRALDSKKLPEKLEERLDAEGIPTKKNPNPSGKDVFQAKQWQKKRIEEMKADEAKRKAKEKEKGKGESKEEEPEETKLNQDDDSYDSVEDYKKNVGKCPPGYSWNEVKRKCVVRGDAKKDEIWKPRKERQQSQEQKGEEPKTSPQEAALQHGSNVAKVMGNFDNLSMPSQKKVLNHTASGTADLAGHFQDAKSPEQRKSVLTILKRIGTAIKPHLKSIFRIHKDEAKAVGNALDKAHHVAVLGKKTQDWVPHAMNAKAVSDVIDGIDGVKI